MPFKKECTSNFDYGKDRMKRALNSENKVGKHQCFCGVTVVLVQVPIAYLVPVTMALKCLLGLYVKHPKWLQHWDRAEIGLEQFFGVFF